MDTILRAKGELQKVRRNTTGRAIVVSAVGRAEKVPFVGLEKTERKEGGERDRKRKRNNLQ